MRKVQRTRRNEWKYTATGGGNLWELLDSPRGVRSETLPRLKGVTLAEVLNSGEIEPEETTFNR